MKVQVGSKVYRVAWKHIHKSGSVIGEKSGKELPYSILTICQIHPIEKGSECLALGKAFCSVNDVFTKDDGRKTSLTKALESSFSKWDRKCFWEAYADEIGYGEKKHVCPDTAMA